MLTRLTYFSENHIDPLKGSALSVLGEIMSASTRNNKASDLTGALVFDSQWFLQTLEGERNDVWRTFERIRDDERHSDVVVAEMIEVNERKFGSWSMRLALRQPATEHIFAPFSASGRLHPPDMSARQIFELMSAVAPI